MRILGNFRTAILLVFFLFPAPSSAEIISMKLRSSSRHVIEFSEFNFKHTGYVSVAVSSVWVTSALSQPDRSRIGFFLLPREVRKQHRPEFRTGGKCILDSKLITLLFTFEDLSYHHQSSFNKSYPVIYPGMNSLYFVNCNKKSYVTMDVHTELYNTDDDRTTKDYLSVGLTQLPSLYFIFFLIYLCFQGFWIFVCFKNKGCLHRTHLLMGLLLFTTSHHFMCAFADRHYVKVTGTPHGWDVFFYMFQFIRDVIFFMVIVLVGTGWRIWKPLLKRTDKLILIDVIGLRVLVNFCSIMVGEISHYSDDWWNWNFSLLLADYSSCAVIFIPMHWSIISLRKARGTDGNAARNLTKMYQFVMTTLGYVFFTRIAPHVVDKGPWVIDAAKETGTLVFCLVMFYMYRPFEKDALGDEEVGLVSLST